MRAGYPHVYVSNALDHFTIRSMGHQVMAWWFVSIKLSADAILQPITHSNETYLAELLHSAILLIRNLPKEIWIFFSEFFTLATFRSQPILYEWEDNTNQLYIVSSFQHTTSGGSHIMEVLQNIWAAGCTIIKLFIRCIFILILSTYFLTIWTTSSSCKKCSLPTFCGLNFTDEPQTSALQHKLLIKQSNYMYNQKGIAWRILWLLCALCYLEYMKNFSDNMELHML